MPQYIITVGEDSTKSKAPEKYEAAVKDIKEKGGSVADEFDWGFIVNFPDDSISVSSIMENKTYETIEDGNGKVTTQNK
ncbi:hypothetical protein EYC80_001589 [Monilinia laxa]|uniref:Inhibitor I9 domain-containing protein n=1 Tax=Monilinia laxa TaxID=61186 RepID=A0A5N6K5I4_MONLA|nr:hypothetical protein EYC80_001589 [Monilinia laxa]